MVIKTNFGTKQASESNLGLVKLANIDEVLAGVSTNTAVHPKGVHAAIDSIDGVIYSVVLFANQWQGNTTPYTYVINSITNIKSTSNLHTIPDKDMTIDQIVAYQNATIVDGGLGIDTITFKALGIKPTIDIPIRIIVSKSLYVESNYTYVIDSLPISTINTMGIIKIADENDIVSAVDNTKAITPSLLAKNKPNGVAGLNELAKIADSSIPDNIARINAPIFTGIPKAPTAALGNNTKQIATTEFVQNATVSNSKLYEPAPGLTDISLSAIWIITNHYVVVYRNGLRLIEGIDYIKTNNTKTITLTNPILNGDKIYVVVSATVC